MTKHYFTQTILTCFIILVLWDTQVENITFKNYNYVDGCLAFSWDHHSSFSYNSRGQFFIVYNFNVFDNNCFLASGKYFLKICLLLVARLEL